MAEVDRDLEEIIRFCKQFDSQYLSTLKENANKLKKISASAQSSLGNTEFATKSSEKLEEAADMLIKAAQSGEERIREIERKTQQQLDEKKRIEDLCR